VAAIFRSPIPVRVPVHDARPVPDYEPAGRLLFDRIANAAGAIASVRQIASGLARSASAEQGSVHPRRLAVNHIVRRPVTA